MHRLLVTAALLAVAVMAAGCGSTASPGGSAATSPAASAEVPGASGVAYPSPSSSAEVTEAASPSPTPTSSAAATSAVSASSSPKPSASARPSASASTAPSAAPSVAPSSSPDERVEVDIEGFAFTPATVRVSVGQEIRWRNRDGATHTVTFSGVSVDSGALGNGATFSHAFSAPGTYPYICSIHPSMTGTVIVE